MKSRFLGYVVGLMGMVLGLASLGGGQAVAQNELKLTDFAVFGQDAVTIFNEEGQNGGVSVNGSVGSNTRVFLGSGCMINGNVIAPQVIGDCDATGTITQINPNINVLEERKPSNITGGGPDQTHLGDAPETIPLMPGIYGDLELGNNKTLNLESGTYEFDEISAGTNTTLNLDVSAGPITILSVGDISFGPNLQVNLSGGEADSVFTETHGKFFLSQAGGGQWFGTVYTPFGVIDIGKQSVLEGVAWSGGAVLIEPGADINPLPGTITIIKEALPEGMQAFEFRGDLGTFTVVDTGVDSNNQTTFPNLTPGTYVVTELNQATEDWYTRDITLSAVKGLGVRFFAPLRMTARAVTQSEVYKSHVFRFSAGGVGVDGAELCGHGVRDEQCRGSGQRASDHHPGSWGECGLHIYRSPGEGGVHLGASAGYEPSGDLPHGDSHGAGRWHSEAGCPGDLRHHRRPQCESWTGGAANPVKRAGSVHLHEQ